MTATNSIVKATILQLSSKRSQNLHDNLCSIKSLQFRATSKFAGLQIKWMMVNSTSSPITITNNNIIRSSAKEEVVEKSTIDDTIIIKSLKRLKIPATVVVSSLLFGMLMYGRCQSALALSGGVMGGHSYSSSSSASSSDDSETRTSSDSSYDPYYSTTCSCCSGVYVSGRHRSRMNISVPPRPIPTLLDFLWLPILLIVTLMMAALITTFIEAVTALLLGDCGKLLTDAVESSSVYKIQVGLSVTGSSLQSDFNRIATTADTSGSSGWKYILEGTIKSLYKHRNDWLCGDSSVEIFERTEAVEFIKQITNEERNKFDEETLVNLNNIKKEIVSSQNQEADESITTYMVVTILVAFQGMHIMSAIFKEENLDRVFSKIRSHYSDIKGVNVLWAPQKANEILSREELEKKYPLLKKISK